VLRAAADSGAAAGSYWGPGGLFELTGPPQAANIAKHARDARAAGRLWEEAERLTGVAYPV
jgi:hypothetical protein